MKDKKTPNSQNRHKIGYARVSSISQNLDSQIDMLEKAGCTKIFTDIISGTSSEKSGWNELMNYLRPKDVLVVTELSRMTRSLSQLLETVKELEAKEVEICSLRENIDNSTAIGRAFLHIMGSIHQMEKELKAERAAAGRKSAKARGRMGGRPPTDPEKLEQARILYNNTDKTAAEICKSVGIGRRTFFAYLAKYNVKKDECA
ncbi:MAG: recombinase family protein [Proteobacteria bacterium]|nr:recombinase family protein [Pseudomonadota bacterium]